jgi:uncharacterized protein
LSEEVLTAPYVLEYTYKRSVGSLLGRFLAGLKEGRVFGVTAPDGTVMVPPASYDPRTGQATGDLVEVGTAGTVSTWTWIANPSERHPLDRPFAFAMIRLDGAGTDMLHVVDVGSAERMSTGMRVRVRWREERVGAITDIEAFEPGEAPMPTEVVPIAGEPIRKILAPVRFEYTIRAGQEASRFLRGLVDRRILGRRSAETGKVYVPPKGVCPVSGGVTNEDVYLEGTGVVTTFCVISFPFEGQLLEPPYAAGEILLDGSDVPLFHLVGGIDPYKIRMGMRVAACWSDTPAPTLESIRYFEPTGEPDAEFSTYAEHL